MSFFNRVIIFNFTSLLLIITFFYLFLLDKKAFSLALEGFFCLRNQYTEKQKDIIKHILFAKVSELTSRDARRTLRTHRLLAGAIKLNKSPSAPDELAQYIIAYENLKKACDSQDQEKIEDALQTHNKALNMLREKYNPRIHKIHMAGLGVIAVAVVGMGLLSGVRNRKEDTDYEDGENSNSVELIEEFSNNDTPLELNPGLDHEGFEEYDGDLETIGNIDNLDNNVNEDSGSLFSGNYDEDYIDEEVAELLQKADEALAAGDTETAALYQKSAEELIAAKKNSDNSNNSNREESKSESILDYTDFEDGNETDVLIAPSPFSFISENFLNETITWQLNENTLVIDGSGVMPNFNTENPAPWKDQYQDISEVIISDGVESVGNNAFYGCSNINSVTIPESVVSIGESAFSGCKNLDKITISKNVTEIGSNAFNSCSQLRQVEILGPITIINNYTFYNCKTLKSIQLPDTVIDIKDHAFSLCSSLSQINLPSSLISLRESAFFGCSGLKQITIPKTVGTIEDYVFFDCSSLNKITFDGDAPQIGESAFKWVTASVCYPHNNKTYTDKNKINYAGNLSWTDENSSNSIASKLTGTIENVCWEIENGCLKIYPNSSSKVKSAATSSSMPDFSFDKLPEWSKYSDKINSVKLQNIHNIGNYAFYGCKNITKVELDTNTKSIGTAAFVNCISLKNITIPKSVKSIKKFAFYGCFSLKKVEIKAEISEISDYCFYMCESLENINLPKSIKKMGSHAFSLCSSLLQINLPDSLEYIGDNAFFGCDKLQTITIPKNVKSMGNYVFFDCYNLSTITFNGNSPKLSDTTLSGTEASTIYSSKKTN